MSKEQKVFKCDECNKTYKTQKTLDSHIIKMHIEPNKKLNNTPNKTPTHKSNQKPTQHPNQKPKQEIEILSIEKSYQDKPPFNDLGEEFVDEKMIPLKEYITLLNELNFTKYALNSALEMLMKHNSFYRKLRVSQGEELDENEKTLDDFITEIKGDKK
jgi:hypothetical protein